MFSTVRRMIGSIKVWEEKNIIYIEGLPANVVMKDIQAHWATSKIHTWIFNSATRSSVSFFRFFAPDIVYALETIANERSSKHNVRAIRKIIEELYLNTWLKDTLIEHPDILNFNKLSDLNIPLFPHQLEFLKMYNTNVPKYKLNGYLLGAAPGSGKAQPMHSHIKIPGGWSTMGEMKVGTEVVTPKGTTTVVTGVYPQGMKDIYRITFSDGRQVDSCDEHLWKVHLRNTSKKDYWKIKSTKEILESTSFTAERAYIPLIIAEDNPPVNLPIDPYLLGAILGDGCIRRQSIVISNPDDFIKEKIKSRLSGDMKIGNLKADIEYNLAGIHIKGNSRINSLLVKLRELNLMGSYSYTKSIPEIYLMGSKQQRLDLLNGLLDTDGTSDQQGTSSFCSTSLDLAEGVQYLVRSLGGIASISHRHPTFTYKGIKKNGRLAYQVNIRHKYPEELFSLPRKKERVSNNNQYANALKLRIEKIEYLGNMPAQCISVADEDHLYITNGFVVTHNTIMGLALGATLEADVVICIVPKNSVDKVWVDTVKTRFSKVTSYWASTGNVPLTTGYKYYIFHYEQLGNAIAFFKNSKYKKPLIILDESHNFNEIDSLRTQSFISLCSVMNAKHVVWASGTLVKAIGNEVMPLLQTLDNFFTPPVAERFKKIFGKSASKAVDILRNRLGLITFKVDKATVVTNTVVTTEKRIQIPNGHIYTLDAIRVVMSAFIKQQMLYYKTNMPTFVLQYKHCLEIHQKSFSSKSQQDTFQQYQTYIEMIRRSYDPVLMKQEVMFCNQYELKVIIPSLPAALREQSKGNRPIVKYYQLKVQGEALGRILGKLRTQCHIDMVRYTGIEEEIESSIKKTVIFTSYVEVVNETDRYLREQGFNPLRVYGDTNKDLVKIVDQFDKDPDANPLIATFQSLSTAVPLIMANTAILMNSPFRAHEYEQSTSRVHRINQDTEVQIVNVLLDTGDAPNISTRSADIMQWSQEQVNAILGLAPPKANDISLESFIDFIEGQEFAPPNYLTWN